VSNTEAFTSVNQVKRKYFPRLWEKEEIERVGLGVWLGREFAKRLREAMVQTTNCSKEG